MKEQLQKTLNELTELINSTLFDINYGDSIRAKEMVVEVFKAFHPRYKEITALPSIEWMINAIRAALPYDTPTQAAQDALQFIQKVYDKIIAATYRTPGHYPPFTQMLDELQKRLDSNISDDYFELKEKYEAYLCDLAETLKLKLPETGAPGDSERIILEKLNHLINHPRNFIKHLASALEIKETFEVLGWGMAEEFTLTRVKEVYSSHKDAEARLEPLRSTLKNLDGYNAESSTISQACTLLNSLYGKAMDQMKRAELAEKDRDQIVLSFLPLLPEPKNLSNIAGPIKALIDNATQQSKQYEKLHQNLEACRKNNEQERQFVKEFRADLIKALGASQGSNLIETAKSIKDESDNNWKALKYEVQKRREAEERVSAYMQSTIAFLIVAAAAVISRFWM